MNKINRRFRFTVLALSFMALGACKRDEPQAPASQPVTQKALASSPVVASTPEVASTAAEAPKPASAASSKPTKLTYQKSVKSTAYQVAVDQYNQSHYFPSITAINEGWRSDLYADNIGCAWAFGWNVSMQSKTQNQKLAQGIGLSPEVSSAIVAASGNKTTCLATHASINVDQGVKSVGIFGDQLSEGMRGVIGAQYFDKLKPNEQDALKYHAYKLGLGGAAKYKTMISLVRKYAIHPTDDLAKQVASQFTYTYMLNGKKMTDTRSGGYIGALFVSPQAYGYLLGQTSPPKDMPAIAKATSLKIDDTKPAPEQIDAQDDFGKAKVKLLESGGHFDNVPIQVSRPSPIIGTMQRGWL
ncbi:TPA: hypothetical protein QDB06_000757 [Burkholderia vietnamiensis]|nr:hypothetical protein [Burkholderia vietnamiensis]